MSVELTIELKGLEGNPAAEVRARMEDRAGMHKAIATETLLFVQGPAVAGKQSARNHRTATNLGATPSGHLERAYQSIGSTHSSGAASLLVPRASRLRAGFGKYVLTPQKSDYLTIPVNKESYGRRAREFDDLIALRTGPRKTLILAREGSGGVLETMYVLVKSAEIPEDTELLPFGKIQEEAAAVAELFVRTGKGGLA